MGHRPKTGFMYCTKYLEFAIIGGLAYILASQFGQRPLAAGQTAYRIRDIDFHTTV